MNNLVTNNGTYPPAKALIQKADIVIMVDIIKPDMFHTYY